MRQVAVLLERENDRLHAKLTALTRELSQLRGEDARAAQRQLDALKEILAHREHALFGASSEQRPQPASAAPAPPAAPPRGHGPKAQPALPVIDMVHELAASDRTCSACGGVLREMAGQTEDSEEITVVERRFVMLHQIRKKYRCTCNGCVETAPGPLRLTTRPDRRGRRYSADFAVEVAIGKYLDHLPLERQVRMMRREGLAIDSQTLWDQLEAAATILQPTYEALRQHVQTAPVIGADETWWRVFVGPAGKRWWAWSLTSETAVTYTILESRSQEAARQVLNGYRGIVIADGYSAYAALAQGGPSLHAGPLLGARPAQIRRGRAALPGAVRRGARPHRAALRGRAGVSLAGGRCGRRRACRPPAAARGPPRGAVDAPDRRDPRLGPRATRAAGEQSRQGDRLHARPVAGADAVPRRSAHSPGQQRHRARAARDGDQSEKSWAPLARRRARRSPRFSTASSSRRSSAGWSPKPTCCAPCAPRWPPPAPSRSRTR